MKPLDKILKKQQQLNDELKEAMLSRCIPVAKRILRLIAADELPIGDVVIPRDASGRAMPMREGERPPEYQKAAKEIQQMMLDANLLWMERQMVFMLVKQPMDMLQNIVLTDLDSTFQHGLCKIFGVETFGEVTFKQVDEMLKGLKKEEKPDENPA